MPELPDVEIFRRRLHEHAKRRTICDARVLDERLLEKVTAMEITKALVNHRIVATQRRGKHLFAALDHGPYLTLHFGMSGELAIVASAKDVPAYTALHLVFDDATAVAVTSRRRLGRIGLAEDTEAFARAHGLGPDALDPTLDAASFRDRLGSARGMIKSALMDQAKLAGIGNIYADEILFQARLNPQKRVGTLSSSNIERLFTTIRQVLTEAVERGVLAEGREGAPPGDWLLPHRDKFGQCPRCGTRLRTSKVGGRTGYFCPTCQPD